MTTATVTAQKPDFGDWLSPMVVKELRQGTRSRNFVTIFLLLQGLLIISMLVGLGSSRSDAGLANGLFWTLITVPLAIFMPLSGLGALSQEVSENTLDLVLLTRLSPRRVVIGKCLGICLQSVLMVTTILPYAVLRYFLGSINVVGELTAIAWLLLVSVLFTVMAVGISAYLSRIGRYLVIVGSGFFLLFASGGVMGGGRLSASRFASGGGGSAFDLWFFLGTFLPIIVILAIEFGASKIAPGTGNHALVKRLCGLALIGFSAFLPLSADALPVYRVLVFMMVGFICFNALLEQIPETPGAYRTLARRGAWGRGLGRILYPGWPSGVLFTLLAGLASLALAVVDLKDEGRGILALCSLVGALLMPMAFQRLFFPKIRMPLIVFFAAQISMVMIAIVVGTVSGATGEKLDWLLLPFPMAQFIMGASGWFNTDVIELHIFATLLVSLGSAIFLVFCSIRAWKGIAPIEKRAAVEKSNFAA